MKDQTIVRRLQEVMDDRNLKQADVVRMCEKVAGGVRMSKVHIHNYVNGKAIPDLEHMIVLANALNVSMDWICGVNEKGGETCLTGSKSSWKQQDAIGRRQQGSTTRHIIQITIPTITICREEEKDG